MSIPVPNPVYLQALDGSTWVPTVTNAGIADTVPMSPPLGVSAQPWYALNDAVTGATNHLVVLPSPSVPVVPPANVGQLRNEPASQASGLPIQLLVSAPNGIIYFLQIVNGILQSGLAVPANASCNVPISTLAANVQDRLEEPRGPGVFWNLQFEIYTAIAEAMNEAMLLVGRPTLAVQMPMNLVPNTPWQSLPKGILALTDIYGAQSMLRSVSLFSMDYEQSSWQSDWECDSSPYGPLRWFPIGLSMFGVHPAPGVSTQVTINAVQYPVAVPYPYTGTEIVVFERHFHDMLEMYAAVYLRMKEGGSELQTALPMLAEFYHIAKRMSEIQDRRDSLVFSNSFGVPSGVGGIVKR